MWSHYLPAVGPATAGGGRGQGKSIIGNHMFIIRNRGAARARRGMLLRSLSARLLLQCDNDINSCLPQDALYSKCLQ